jgi:hypothetical protein
VIEERLSRLLRTRVRRLRPVVGRGYSVAFRAVAELEDGGSVFVKAGTEELTNSLLRVEQRFYRSLEGPFLPQLVAFDEGEPPLLVLEDLSEARWPPPWDESSIDAVLRALAAIAAIPPPAVVHPIGHERERFVGGWAEIEREPGPFLSLGLCSHTWLERSLPDLRGAAETAPIDGGALIHLDVRSDNLCFTDRGAVLVDWNQACVANPALDVAAWLPSLRLEGGPEPEDLLPNAGGFAALLAGFFGSRAGLAPPATAPHVRPLQLAQLRVALPWAARELALPLPG